MEDTINHTPACIVATTNHQRLRAAFAIYWSDYCTTCNGLGGSIYYYDPSPSGVSLGAGWMEEFEPCPDCLEQGICPRCGKKEHNSLMDDHSICPHCGWDSEHADRHSRYTTLSPESITEQCLSAFDMHAVPPEPECFCYEQVVDNVYDEYRDMYGGDDVSHM